MMIEKLKLDGLALAQEENPKLVERVAVKTNTQYGSEHFRTVVKELQEGRSINQHTEKSKVKARYNDMYWVRRGGSKYEIQFATDPSNPKDSMKITTAFDSWQLQKGSRDAKFGVSARIWKTNKNAKDGPVATCYKLLKGQDGKDFWVKQTAREVRTEDGVNYWKLDDEEYSFVSEDEVYQLTTDIYEASGVYDKAKQN